MLAMSLMLVALMWMLTLCLRLIICIYSLLRLAYHHTMELFFFHFGTKSVCILLDLAHNENSYSI